MKILKYITPNYSVETLTQKSTEFAILFDLIEETISYFDGLPYFNKSIQAKHQAAKNAMIKFKNVCGLVEREVINTYYNVSENKEAMIAFSNLIKSVINLPFRGEEGRAKIIALGQVVYDEEFEIVDTEAYNKDKQDLQDYLEMQMFSQKHKVEITQKPNRFYVCVVDGQEKGTGLTFFEALQDAIKNTKQ